MGDKGKEMGMENTKKCIRTGTDYCNTRLASSCVIYLHLISARALFSNSLLIV